MSRRRVLVLLAGGAVLAAGAWGWVTWGHSPDRTVTRIAIDRRDIAAADMPDLVTPLGLQIVAGADRVELFKIEVGMGVPWKVIRQRDGTPKELKEARDVLTSPAIYSWGRRGGHKKCGGFQPRDGVRFWRGRESVAFLICFTCADVGVVVHDAEGTARQYMIADVQPGTDELRKMMNGFFPGTVPKDPHER